MLKHHTEADHTDQEGVLAEHQTVLAEDLKGLHTVPAGGQEGHQKIATGGDPWEDLEEHHSHRAAGDTVNGLGVDQEVRRRVVAGMEVAHGQGIVGRSLVEDIRNSCCCASSTSKAP